jgi:hypothetical protein
VILASSRLFWYWLEWNGFFFPYLHPQEQHPKDVSYSKASKRLSTLRFFHAPYPTSIFHGKAPNGDQLGRARVGGNHIRVGALCKRLHELKMRSFISKSIIMKKGLLLAISLAVGLVVRAQEPTVIFSEEFNGGLGAFTSSPGQPVGAVWQWRANARADTVIVNNTRIPAAFWGGLPAINSPSAANGAAVFNSDAYDSGGSRTNLGSGPFPAPQTASLTSSNIDCSAFERVTLSFYQFARTLIDDNTLVEVSGDGGATWKEYRPNERVLSNEINGIISANSRVVIDISDVAGNSSQVRLRFTWSGFYYFWIIDDVKLLESPANNLGIADFFYPLSSFATPQSQIATDTFGFGVAVANFGSADQSDVLVYASVINASGEELYLDSVIVDLIRVGDTLNVVFPNTFTPELPRGVYAVLYDVLVEDVADFYPNDNSDGEVFVVTDGIFSKEDGFLDEDAEWPSGFPINQDYQIGNVYTMSPLSGSGFVVGKVTFNAFHPQDFTGQELVTLFLYKVKDRVAPNFANFNIQSQGSGAANDDLEVAGFGSYVFPPDHDSFGFGTDVELEDLLGNPVRLEPGARYFLVASYQDRSNEVIHNLSDDITYADGLVSTIVFVDGRWFLGGFNRNASAILRMEIMSTDAADRTPLPDNAVRLFPNPTSSQLYVQLDLEAATDALVIITDVSGKVLKWQPFQKVQGDTLQFDVSGYPAGAYFLRVGTEKGTRTLKFIVNR